MNTSQGSFPVYPNGLMTSSNASQYYTGVDYNTFDTSLYMSDLDSDLYLDLRPLNIVLIVLYGIIFLSGLFGNIIVIISIIRFKSLRTLTNYFLLNLTIGDILVIIVCIPLTLGSTIYKKWVYGEMLCKLFPFLQGSAVSVSVLSLLSITGSRCVAIYRPLVSKIVFSKRNVRMMILLIWIISCAAMLPFTLMVDASSCQNKRNQILLQQRRRTVKMLVCILVTFGICWLPYYAVNFWIDANIDNASKTEIISSVYRYCFPLVILLGLSNSAVNPVFYYIMCRGFRRSFNTILCSGLLKRGEQLLGQTVKAKRTMSESVDTALL
ncbi:cholecystokinin receptor-like [Mya arenaria]|uniref:cholecystokinin receptor-like n=1 Tax=Mya arenaria TaxID=6604 RepID=UPI0022DFF5E0|nr:cholecystokinin receptor-like [Mya arenaria]